MSFAHYSDTAHPTGMHYHRLRLTVCGLLILATAAVFWQVKSHEFLAYDDNEYVTENLPVQSGLSAENVAWAFTATYANFWHPLTWLSHMLDCQVYGANSGGHHLTNLVFHIASTLLLFFFLERTTLRLWPSAFAASLFALHPLHVESVAWVAERKDVLSAFFWMVTLFAYGRYARRPGARRYLVILVSFTLGLMAKPMLVTLPFVLLLLDYWPLGRFASTQTAPSSMAQDHVSISSVGAPPDAKGDLGHLLWEKLPFFVLSAVFSVLVLLTQHHGGAVESLGAFPLKVRVANALISYVVYIRKMFWPSDLSPFYLHPGNDVSLWLAAGSGLLLATVTVLALKTAARRKYFVVGWLWYVGTLVPVIGLVQVGKYGMADRFTYIPLVGLFLAIAWSAADYMAPRRCGKTVLAVSAAAVLIAMGLCSWFQIGAWKNSPSVFERALHVSEDNYWAHHNLGVIMARQGRFDEAVGHYSEVVRLQGQDPKAHKNLGAVLARLGRLDEAVAHFLEALRLDPDYAEAHNDLGIARLQEGKLDEAIAHFSEALRIHPDYGEAHNNIGIARLQGGQLDEAIAHFSEALRVDPDNPDVRDNLEFVLRQEKEENLPK